MAASARAAAMNSAIANSASRRDCKGVVMTSLGWLVLPRGTSLEPKPDHGAARSRQEFAIAGAVQRADEPVCPDSPFFDAKARRTRVRERSTWTLACHACAAR